MAPSVHRVDGRHARKDRTREAIVGAVLALLDEGEIEPTAAQIAERAEVAVRSIAQHFRAREQLMLAVAAHHAARQPGLAPAPKGAPLGARLGALLTGRVAELEGSRALRRAATRGAATSPAIARGLAEVVARRRRELRAALGPELRRAGRASASAIELVLSGPAWDVLRDEQQLPAAAAAKVVSAAVRRLLGA